MRFAHFIHTDARYGKLAYICLVITLIGIILAWSAIFILTIQVNVGDQVNANGLIILNLFTQGCAAIFLASVLSGIAAFVFSIGTWQRFFSVLGLLIGLAFFWIMTCFRLADGTQYSYELATSKEYAGHTFNVIHAYHSGDVVYQADYLLLDCDLSGNSCSVMNRFHDFRLYESRSQPVSLYVESSDQALYIKVGDETKLVSKV